MPVPSSFDDLSTTPSSNSPSGSEPVGPQSNDYLQAAFAFIKQLATGWLKADGTVPMTGLLTLSGDPTAALNPASKQYVDGKFLPLSGGTLTGNLVGTNVSIAGFLTTYQSQITSGYSVVGTTGGAGTAATRYSYAGTMAAWNGSSQTWGPDYAIWNTGNFTPGNYATLGYVNGTFATLAQLNGKQNSGNYVTSNSADAIALQWGSNGRIQNIINGTAVGLTAYVSDVNQRFYSADGRLSTAWGVGAGYLAIFVDGNPYQIAISASDERLKENIQPSSADALSVINRVPMHEFNFRENGFFDHRMKHKVGFIAQELQAVDPTFVTGGDDVVLSPNQLALLAYLWKAVQQLSAEVASLRAARDV